MAAQAALIEETIIGLKKALRREHEHSGPDEAITQPTNRGNKLKLNANHVHEGVLGFTDPLNLYKQKIEHAGYTRYILHRNPPRYDSEGDEIEGEAEEDADSETAAEANEDNPFAGIALEHVLCPLKQASELPDHPTLSQPYRSKALSTMIQAIEEKLRKERALLARAHNLHRFFLGDSVWMPCGAVESKEDPYMFISRVEEPSNRQLTNDDVDMQDKSVGNNSNGDNSRVDTTSSNPDERHEGDDIEMTEGPRPDTMKGEETRESKAEETIYSARNGSRPIEHGAGHSTSGDSISSAANGNLEKQDKGADTMTSLPQAAEAAGDDTPMQDAPDIQDSKVKDATSSPEPPRRMTTRARANASTGGENEGTIGSSSRYTSPGAITNSSTAHPLFLVSDNIRPDKDFGLPPNEAEDTRRLLWSYIQKQEETVRGFTYMLNSLLRAEQLKENVFEWCKAEGHIGEMSDGEDWYDREKWGLTDGEDLKKGADDDEVENTVTEERTTGKRGRRRQ